MLPSLGIILLSALLLGSMFKKIKMPSLFGMIIVGIILGPFVLDLIDGKILEISSELRELALVIILTRAGLSLSFGELKNVGKSALLMSFLPATAEIIGYTIFATLLFKTTIIEGLLIGSVMAAVSPAVVVPRMLSLKEEGYAQKSGLPSLITAASSVDDVYVIVLFTSFLGLTADGCFDFSIIWQIPTSIILGIAVGLAFGFILTKFHQKFHLRDSIKVLLMLSFSFLFLGLEALVGDYVPYSALLSIITTGITIGSLDNERAKRLSNKFNKLWVFAEIMLFVLVGCAVDISYVTANFLSILAVVLIAMLFRMLGVLLALIKSPFNKKERLFAMLAYTPKATVQAGIGGVALAMGLPIGQTVLSFAIVGILITAPLGAILIDTTYKKLLEKE